MKLRRHLEQFNRLLDSCADADPAESRIANEARISMIDVLGKFILFRGVWNNVWKLS